LRTVLNICEQNALSQETQQPLRVELEIVLKLIDDKTFIILVSTSRTPCAFEIISQISHHICESNLTHNIECEEYGLCPEDIPDSPAALLRYKSFRLVSDLIGICQRQNCDDEKAICYSFYFGSASDVDVLIAQVAVNGHNLKKVMMSIDALSDDLSAGFSTLGHSIESSISIVLSACSTDDVTRELQTLDRCIADSSVLVAQLLLAPVASLSASDVIVLVDRVLASVEQFDRNLDVQLLHDSKEQIRKSLLSTMVELQATEQQGGGSNHQAITAVLTKLQRDLFAVGSQTASLLVTLEKQ
jgi:hypothetical protein